MLLLTVAGATIAGFPPIADNLPVALQWVVSILRFVVLAVLLILGLAVLYRYAPNRDEPKWTWVSWGSVVATVLWTYFSSVAILVGNELNAELARLRRQDA